MTDRTLLRELGESRVECIKLVEEATALLEKHGRKAKLGPPPGNVKLALLGQYNAGKSTLVNALFGERRARTGDAPETKVAQSYTLDGYDVIDLPGGEARIAEQQEAMRALDEAHAVIYVVSSKTGLDYETFWRDLLLLQERRLPHLLVVNDKQPHETEEEAEAYRKTLLGGYRDRAQSKMGGHEPPPYWIFAARAERGRIDGKEGLVAHSGIVPLEEALAQFIGQNEPFLRELARLAPLRAALADLQEEAEKEIEDEFTQGGAEALRACDTAREHLTSVATVIAEERFGPLQTAISTTLSRHVSSKASTSSVATEVTELCQGVFDSALGAFVGRAQADLAMLQSKLEKALPKAQVEKGGLKQNLGSVPRVEASKTDMVDIGRRLTGVASALQTITKGVAGELAKRGAKVAAEEAGVALAKAGGKEIVERGAEGLAKSAGKSGGKGLGKAIGPIVTVAVAAWEVWDAYKKAAREKQAVANALREAEAKAALAAAGVKDEFLSRAHGLLAEVLGPPVRELRAGLAQAQQARRSRTASVATISALRGRLADAMDQLQERTRG